MYLVKEIFHLAGLEVGILVEPGERGIHQPDSLLAAQRSTSSLGSTHTEQC